MYEDYPLAKAYSQVGWDCEGEDYEEGIYVGYRYFNSFGIEPRYEFGFGLSYTTFLSRLNGVSQSDGRVKMDVTVQNTGDTFSGKEVLQVYVRKPWGRMDHEKLSLAAFCKTEELKPGKSSQVQLEFTYRDLASYDQGLSLIHF